MSSLTEKCKLCGCYGQLVEGHIWPAFTYKRFVSDLEKDGRFADMMKVNWRTSQYKKHWFCHQCDNELLSGIEKYAAEFSTQFKEGVVDPYVYTERLLPFVTSISWRVTLFHIERENIELNAHGKACAPQLERLHGWDRKWDCAYSQHAFVVFDQEEGRGLHRGIGGEVYPAEGLVLSHLGPLFMVGWLDRRNLSAEEEVVWRAVRFLRQAGQLRNFAPKKYAT